MPGLLVVIAIIAAVLAIAFFFQWQSASSGILALKAESDTSRKEAETARAELKKAQDELKQRSALLTETREKLADTRKKAQEGKKPQQSRSTRESELEEDLTHARHLAEEAHAAGVAARKERDEARAAEQRQKAELEKAQARIRELSARPAQAAPAAVAAAPVSPDIEAVRKELTAQQAELRTRMTDLDKQLQESKRKEADLREDLRRFRGRAETNNRVYLVTKGELDMMKERLAVAERKLWQAGIPLTPPEKKERPKAKGPAAADRPREEQGESAAAAEVPAQATAEMPTAASVPAPESIPTPSENATPKGVAPIRRRAEGDASAKPEKA